MQPRRRYTVPFATGGSLALGDRPLVMGVINVTPDSFSDGGDRFDPTRAVEAGVRMEEEGADLIDIGGESTRPGAAPVDEAEEQRRLLPVIAALAARVRVPISVDTYRASTAASALTAGAALINDISGLRYDPELASVAAASGAPIVLMHTRGRSSEMYAQASYHDVVDEVLDELRESIAFAVGAGVTRDRIIVDPGLGFAKEARHSYEVMGRLEAFADLDRPMLVGASRKSFLTRPLSGIVPPAERDWATAAAVTVAVLAGAHIIRVHAVREMTQVVRVAEEIRRYHS